jgi:PPOX class probable F420-dependent enzyme
MPHASRPHMPGYGIQGPDEGSGLLPWSWADERLTAARYYWVTTLWPDGRPHSMPVWAAWDGESLWFSSSARSRKARNVAADPRCVVTTDDAESPVVIEGSAELVRARDVIERVAQLLDAKYGGITADFLAANATIRVSPERAFGIAHDDFTGSPTRWVFG